MSDFARFQFLLLTLFSALLLSCATSPPEYTVQERAENGSQARAQARAQARVAAAARSLVGRKRLPDAAYNLDCTGVVLFIYNEAGIPLDDAFAAARGNGVARLYSIGKDASLLNQGDDVHVGDVIFWDNSYDHNDDGIWNDPLTHTAVAVAIDRNGTITYVHHNYRRGIVEAQMNLSRPADTVRNSPMRMRGQRVPGHSEYLSGELYRISARLYELGVK